MGFPSLKVIIFLGIIILAVSLVFGMIHQPIYADGGCEWLSVSEQDFYSQVLCYVIAIHEQNEQIIVKQDWTNCVLLNKDSDDYYTPMSWDHWGWQTASDLMDECGTMP
ncbi:hypothetical protein LCGC14_0586540 [marine sediment metagenome]|uniref:Uncharacterized protein n=1 Tax=marine sediment metagenome TaxID=412755 RepID=A0A0F9UN65_9ZZZZ